MTIDTNSPAFKAAEAAFHDVFCSYDSTEPALAAAIEAYEAAQWRDIETAPHKTDVLMTWAHKMTGARCYEAGWASGGERVGYTSSAWLHGSATHWRPLPTPPEAK
jgi:hypothetical protein